MDNNIMQQHTNTNLAEDAINIINNAYNVILKLINDIFCLWFQRKQHVQNRYDGLPSKHCTII